MIYKKYEITKQEDVFTGKGFLYVIHSPNKDDYYHHDDSFYHDVSFWDVIIILNS